MTKVHIELEFDDDNLGPKWMNIDNLALLLYTDTKVSKKSLKINSFKELDDTGD